MRSVGRKLGAVVVALGLVAGLAGAAWAGSKGGVFMPDRTVVEGKSLVLNGMGIREATVLSIDVYVSGLYLEQKTRDAKVVLSQETTKHLTMQFVRDVDREDIVESFEDGFKKAAGVKYGRLKGELKRLNGWVSDVKKGDKASFTYLPGKGLQFRKGSRLMGTVESAEFAEVFFGIWFGSSPPNKGLKTGMLGQ